MSAYSYRYKLSYRYKFCSFVSLPLGPSLTCSRVGHAMSWSQNIPALGCFYAGTPRVPSKRGDSEDPEEHDLGFLFKIELDPGGGQGSRLFHFIWLRDNHSRSLAPNYIETSLAPRDARTWSAIRCVGRAQCTDAGEFLVPPTLAEFDHATSRYFTLEDATHLWRFAAAKATAIRRKFRLKRSPSTQRALPAKRRTRSIPPLLPAALKAATIGHGVEVRPSSIGPPTDNFGLFATRSFKPTELVTMYDGTRLEGGREEACALETQTHVAASAGVYWDGYPLTRLYRSQPKLLDGRGGGAFANHNPRGCKVDVWLSAESDSYNCIFLRVKPGKHLEAGEEIFHDYGAGYPVAMGWDRFGDGPRCRDSFGAADAGDDRRPLLHVSAVRATVLSAISAVLSAARTSQPPPPLPLPPPPPPPPPLPLPLPLPAGATFAVAMPVSYPPTSAVPPAMCSECRLPSVGLLGGVHLPSAEQMQLPTAGQMHNAVPPLIATTTASTCTIAPPLPPPPPRAPLPRVGALQVGDWVEAEKATGVWAAARVVRVQQKSSRPVVTIEYEYRVAPARVWTFISREDEMMGNILAWHYPAAVLEQVLPALLQMQSCGAPRPSRATDRLRAFTEVVLPEVYKTREDERPSQIARRFGCDIKALVDLNVSLHPDLQMTSKLRCNTLVVLPPCWRPGAPRPAQPKWATAAPEVVALAVGDAVYIKCDPINGSPDMETPVWRPAKLTHVHSRASFGPRDAAPYEAVVDGDLAWLEKLNWGGAQGEERAIEEDGEGWIRAFPGVEPFSMTPGELIPPWAERKPKEVLRARHPPRDLPEALASAEHGAWFASLTVHDRCEVFFEQGWQAATVDNMAPDGLFVRVLRLNDYLIKASPEILRPRTKGYYVDGDSDEDEEEVAEAPDSSGFDSGGFGFGSEKEEEEKEEVLEGDDNEVGEEEDEEEDDKEELGDDACSKAEIGEEVDALDLGDDMEHHDDDELEMEVEEEEAAAEEEEEEANKDVMEEEMNEVQNPPAKDAYTPYVASHAIFSYQSVVDLAASEKDAVVDFMRTCTAEPRLVSGFLSSRFCSAAPLVNHRDVDACMEKAIEEGGTSGSKLMEHVKVATLHQGSFGLIAAAIINMVPKGRRLRAAAPGTGPERSFLACQVLVSAVHSHFEKQGVDSRLLTELSQVCRSELYTVDHLLVLHPPGTRVPRESVRTALLRCTGGVHSDYGECKELVDYQLLADAMGVDSLPDALLLPWRLPDASCLIVQDPGKVKSGRRQPAPRPRAQSMSSPKPRALVGFEVCMGSGRLAKALARKGWEMAGIEREVAAPEYDDDEAAEPLLAHPGGSTPGRIKLLIKSLRDIRVADFPTVDFMHFSLDCTSVSNAAGNKHGRQEDIMGTSPESREYNQDLMHAILICKDQMARPNNADFKFT